MNDSGPEGPSRTLLEQLPFAAHIEHPYTPRETALYGRANHVVVEEEVRIGRIHRSSRDTLCRPREHFWGLYRGGEDHVPSCRRCTEIAERVIADPGSVSRSEGAAP